MLNSFGFLASLAMTSVVCVILTLNEVKGKNLKELMVES